eukprot:COSAG05_NODE_11192_length_526_cov_0.601874_1_plen_63_part_10
MMIFNYWKIPLFHLSSLSLARAMSGTESHSKTIMSSPGRPFNSCECKRGPRHQASSNVVAELP